MPRQDERAPRELVFTRPRSIACGGASLDSEVCPREGRQTLSVKARIPGPISTNKFICIFFFTGHLPSLRPFDFSQSPMGCSASVQADACAPSAQSPTTRLDDTTRQKHATADPCASSAQSPNTINRLDVNNIIRPKHATTVAGLQEAAAAAHGPDTDANTKQESRMDETPAHIVCPRFSPSSDTAHLPPKIATSTALLAGGDATSTKRALSTAASKLHAKLEGVADLVICTCTCQHRAADVLATAAELFDGIPFAANTSHGGLATEEHNLRVQRLSADATPAKRPAVLGLWAIRDAAGAFAVASAKVEGEGDDAAHETAGRKAVLQARSDVEDLAAAGMHLSKATSTGYAPEHVHEAASSLNRRHEMLMWMYAAPGCEEAAVRGVTSGIVDQETNRQDSVLLGSTSADERSEGLWWQLAKPTNRCGGVGREPEAFCGEGWKSKGAPTTQGVVVVCMRPSFEFTPVYSHGYAPSIHAAVVAENARGKDGKTDERVIKTLKPLTHGQRTSTAKAVSAAELYNMWTGGHFEEQLQKAKDGPPPEEDPQKWPGVNILGPGSYFPLGLEGADVVANPSRQTKGEDKGEDGAVDWRIAGLDRVGNQPSVLLHPAFIKEDGSLQVFSSAPPDAVVRLLVGTAQALVNNISVVSDSLDERAPFAREHVLGSLFFFCGGTMDCVVNDQTIETFGGAGADDDAETRRGAAVAEAFSTATSGKPFLMSHPFGEQCKQLGWARGVHANLMFGGVVFGKAAFGLSRPAQLFISYSWGAKVSSQEGGQPKFETQLLVTKLKADLEKSLRLTCWLDIERMGAGASIDNEMENGVKGAHVFICCLTDAYLSSPNCLKEFKAAASGNKLIIPLLLPGYIHGTDVPESQEPPPKTPWPPSSLREPLVSLTLGKDQRLYVDMRTEQNRDGNFQQIVNQIDALVRSQRAKTLWGKSKTLSSPSHTGRGSPPPHGAISHLKT